jgi:nucleoside diphosphate kinase
VMSCTSTCLYFNFIMTDSYEFGFFFATTRMQIKPDGVQRGIVGNIISRFEMKGYRLVALKTKQATKELLELHYKDLVAKPFFPKMRDYMLSGPVRNLRGS